jgi:hypothetical protein
MIFLFYIDNLLDISFKQIEDIITRASNPIYVRQSIAERFALVLPEDHDRTRVRKRRSSWDTSSTSSTPIELDSDNSGSENLTRKKTRRFDLFLIKNMI